MTIAGNSAAAGGGVCSRAYVTCDNSTISGNTATTGGGGFYLKISTTQLDLNSCTVTTNSAATFGGGVFCGSGTTSATWNNTVVAGNLSPAAPDLSFDSSQVTIGGNNNLIGIADTGNATLTGSNNLTGTLGAPLDPLLGPLANYGGITPTHSLLPGSPCINGGSTIAGITTDQRGYLRTYGSAPDIGAFELQSPRVMSIVVNDGSAQRSRVTSITVNFDSLVTLPSVAANAFQLKRQSDYMLVGLTASVTNSTTTSVTLQFNGALSDSASLQDGRYTMTVLANQVSNFISALDGNADGTAGDDYVLIGSPANGLFRLFGDADGNGTVDGVDFGAFRNAFNTNSIAFDFDGNGVVDGLDFGRFRARFGVMI